MAKEVLEKDTVTGGFQWQSAVTGTGSIVYATSPTLITPVLGVATATTINKVAITAPAASATITIANTKTLTVSNTVTFSGTDSSTVAFGAGGTISYTSGRIDQNNAATTSAQLASIISDETGSGSLVFATTPTLVTPVLGVATATSINKVTINAPATAAVLTLADGSTLATSGANSITLTSTGATNITLPTTGTISTLAGSESLSNKTIVTPTISGALSLGTDIVGVTGVNHSIYSANATGATVSYNMTLASGTTAEANSGTVTITTGTVSTLGASGSITVGTGNSSTSGSTGTLTLSTGVPVTGNSGTISISSGQVTTGTSGNVGNSTGNVTTGPSGSIINTTGTASTVRGAIINRSPVFTIYQPAPSTVGPGADTITPAELISGILQMTPTTGATRALTLPTGADLANALSSQLTTSDSFDFVVQNLQTTAATDTITLTASVGITIEGDPLIFPLVAARTAAAVGRFRIRQTGAATFICYRVG